MAESSEVRSDVRQMVERAVAQVLAHQLPQLQAELVARVIETLPAPAEPHSPIATAGAGNLVQAVAAIHAGSTQKEILRALLDNGSAHGARLALFVVKAGTAMGWESRGFDEGDAIKDFSLGMSSGPMAHAYQNRVATPGNVAEMDESFVERFGSPQNEQVLALPLLLKDKVAALLYADGGANGRLDAASLELLVMATSAWLEVAALRKQAHKESAEPAAVAAAPMQAVSSHPDPFAAHTPIHTAPIAVPEPEPAAEVVELSAAAHAAAAGAAASAPATAADPFASLSPEDADTHRKAQRFARLLVDEIKLYNQAKVAEGRKHKDLYDRMKDDIEKSRGTYQKRYGQSAAAAANYFHAELLRSLAEDDVSIMGPNFRR